MDIDYVTCPKCKSKTWEHIPNLEDKNKYKFRCVRCRYTVTLGACAKCKTPNAWVQIQGVDEKGGHKPIFRYQCKTCKRIVGILID